MTRGRTVRAVLVAVAVAAVVPVVLSLVIPAGAGPAGVEAPADPAMAAAATAQRMAAADVVDVPVRFQVRNTNRSAAPCTTPDGTFEVAGHLTAPAAVLADPGAGVTLYLHDFSTGEWYWRLDVDGYHYTEEMARRGLASVTIDRLGYGASDRVNGFHTCVGAQADVTDQIVGQLRSGSYTVDGLPAAPAFGGVTLAGLGTGAQIAQLAALFGRADGLVVMGFADVGRTDRFMTRVFGSLSSCMQQVGPDQQPTTEGGYATFDMGSTEYRQTNFHDTDPAVLTAALPQQSPHPCKEVVSQLEAITSDLRALGTHHGARARRVRRARPPLPGRPRADGPVHRRPEHRAGHRSRGRALHGAGALRAGPARGDGRLAVGALRTHAIEGAPHMNGRRITFAAGALAALALTTLMTCGQAGATEPQAAPAPAPAAAAQPAPAPTDVVDVPVSFQVQNVNRSLNQCATDGLPYTVRGYLTGPAAVLTGSAPPTVTLYVHGTNTAQWIWRLDVDGYNFVEELAERGHVSVTIDRLGYGENPVPDGFATCTGGNADIAHQVVDHLRAGTYQVEGGTPTRFGQVFMGGHSSGALVAELVAYSFGNIDGIVATGWAGIGITDETARRFFPMFDACQRGQLGTAGPGPEAAGYTYFDPTLADFYHASVSDEVDPRVHEAMAAHHVRSPCGVMVSEPIAIMEDLTHLGRIDVPVLLVFGAEDTLREGVDPYAGLFLASPDVSETTVPGAGHITLIDVNSADRLRHRGRVAGQPRGA